MHVVTRHPAGRALALTLLAVLTALVVAVLLPAQASAGDLGELDAAAEDAPELTVADRALAVGIEDRQPLAPATTFEVGDRVSAWLQIVNPGADTTVEIVWIHDGKTRSQIALDVGHSSRGWRTWAHKTLRKGDAGRWTVQVHDADGNLLETLSFDVASAPAPSARVAGTSP